MRGARRVMGVGESGFVEVGDESKTRRKEARERGYKPLSYHTYPAYITSIGHGRVAYYFILRLLGAVLGLELVTPIGSCLLGRRYKSGQKERHTI